MEEKLFLFIQNTVNAVTGKKGLTYDTDLKNISIWKYPIGMYGSFVR